jgi:hypothetical protein
MNFVLFVLDSLTGQEKIVNRFFGSEKEAYQYCDTHDLIFSRVISEQEYQSLMMQKEQERIMRQQYPRYQQPQQPRTMITVQEQEPEKPPGIPRPPRPVFTIIRPHVINPSFVHRRKP